MQKQQQQQEQKKEYESIFLSYSLCLPVVSQQARSEQERSGKRQADRRVEIEELASFKTTATVGPRGPQTLRAKPSQTFFFLFRSKIPRPGRYPFLLKSPQISTDRPEGPSRANPEPLSGLG